jgi:hypothetical protein
LPTYHLKPEEDCKFYASQAKQIAQEMLEEELSGKVRALCGFALNFTPHKLIGSNFLPFHNAL